MTTTARDGLHPKFGIGSISRSAASKSVDRRSRVMFVMLSRRGFRRAFMVHDRNIRLSVWLAGFHIEIYDELIPISSYLG